MSQQTPALPTVTSMSEKSAANVEGYVETARLRLRRTLSAEGGHGTKRNRKLMTSAGERRMKTSPDRTKLEGTDETAAAVVKAELDAADDRIRQSTRTTFVQDDDGEEWDKVEVEESSLKAEAKFEEKKEIKREVQGTHNGSAGGAVEETQVLPIPTRDKIMSERKSKRHHQFCALVSCLTVAITRARRVLQQSHHPVLWKVLVAKYGADGLVEGVKAFLAQAHAPADCKTDLKPCWVASKKDPVMTPTSAAVAQIIQWVHTQFSLLPLVHGDGEPVEPSSRSTFWSRISDGKALGQRILESNALASVADFTMIFHAVALRSGLTQKRVVVAFETTEILSVVFPPAEPKPTGAEAAAVPEESSEVVVEEAVAAPNENEDVQEINEELFKKASRILSRKRGRQETWPGPKEQDGKAASGVGKRGGTVPAKGPDAVAEAQHNWVWCDVWCPIRQKYFCVNPCPSLQTSWGAAYTFAVGFDHATDVSCRHASKWSDIFPRRIEAFAGLHRGLVWPLQEKVDPNVPPERHHSNEGEIAVQRILQAFNERHALKHTRDVLLPRESKQLTALMYTDPVPVTFAALKRHPLYICESDVGKFEGIWPKDKTTKVGVIKNKPIFRRSAIVPLYSRDGWLRHHRLVTPESEPAKLIAPPPSRPLAPAAQLFGFWQTVPFHPLPLQRHSDGSTSIPLHGTSTKWYVLLDQHPPEGIAHLQLPHISRVARKMRCEFAFAVSGFEKRSDANSNNNRAFHQHRWSPIFSGIVVQTADEDSIRNAHKEWIQLQEEAELKRRKVRALRWWRLFLQRRMAMARLEIAFLNSVGAGSK